MLLKTIRDGVLIHETSTLCKITIKDVANFPQLDAHTRSKRQDSLDPPALAPSRLIPSRFRPCRRDWQHSPSPQDSFHASLDLAGDFVPTAGSLWISYSESIFHRPEPLVRAKASA